jgi:SAM-dependent methyltransferase
MNGDLVGEWLQALERRHLANLTTREAARALRALSSCYVERRTKLADGAALGSAGKRAAFALFYGPLHFLVTREIVRALPAATARATRIIDLGCGTGAAGAAWALAAKAPAIEGFDRSPWAVAEANWTYRQFRLDGRAVPRDIARTEFDVASAPGMLAAYAINELAPEARDSVLRTFVSARGRGADILVVEPIARTSTPWWREWEAVITKNGGRADEWRFPADLPPLQRSLAKAAGLDPRELTARSFWWEGAPGAGPKRARQRGIESPDARG